MVRSSWCGCLCICPWAEQPLVDGSFKKLLQPEHDKLYKEMNKLTIISPSFWGFQYLTHLPPNVVLTGPILVDDESAYQDNLRRKDAELSRWLDDALEKNELVAYITLGSEIVWQQWYVDVMYEGA